MQDTMQFVGRISNISLINPLPKTTPKLVVTLDFESGEEVHFSTWGSREEEPISSSLALTRSTKGNQLLGDSIRRGFNKR